MARSLFITARSLGTVWRERERGAADEPAIECLFLFSSYIRDDESDSDSNKQTMGRFKTVNGVHRTAVMCPEHLESTCA